MARYAEETYILQDPRTADEYAASAARASEAIRAVKRKFPHVKRLRIVNRLRPPLEIEPWRLGESCAWLRP